MKFVFSESLVEDYQRDGYVIFREIVPPSLLADLRCATDHGRELARYVGGRRSERLLVKDLPRDRQAFDDYANLPELRDALRRMFSSQHTYGTPGPYLSVMIEPEDFPYCIPWHQDLRHFYSPSRPALTTEAKRDPDLFNQINCALYRDDCLWVVPGSHARDDSPAERAAFPEDIPPGPALTGNTHEERERICLEYCRRMPGATCVHLEAGDLCIYRNTMWHTGNYVPYAKRATILDLLETPAYVALRASFGLLSPSLEDGSDESPTCTGSPPIHPSGELAGITRALGDVLATATAGRWHLVDVSRTADATLAIRVSTPAGEIILDVQPNVPGHPHFRVVDDLAWSYRALSPVTDPQFAQLLGRAIEQSQAIASQLRAALRENAAATQ